MKHHLKSLALCATTALGFAAPAQAALWSSENVLGRKVEMFSPIEVDRAGAAPTIVVFDQDAPSGRDISERFSLWQAAKTTGFRAIYVGGADPGQAHSVPSDDIFLPEALRMVVMTGSSSPKGLYAVAFGDAALRAYQFACENPGMLRGVVAIDYQVPQGDDAFSCDDATGLFVLSIHEGKPRATGPAGQEGARDTQAIDALLDEMRARGAAVQSMAVSGKYEDFPNIAAKFHYQVGVSLEEITDLFIKQTLPK
jgi:hypothetical protein